LISRKRRKTNYDDKQPYYLVRNVATYLSINLEQNIAPVLVEVWYKYK